MKYEFHPEAVQEFEEAARYYAGRCAGLELRFIGSIEAAIQRIINDPTRWRILDGNIRRCLAHVFPYAVLYTVESDRMLIIAVMHCHRAPDYWRRRNKPDA